MSHPTYGLKATPRRQWATFALAERRAEGVAVGRSMRPVVNPGGRVRCERRRPRLGEVALYFASGQLRGHRILATADGAFVVRGDWPGVALERVPSQSVIGAWVDAGPVARAGAPVGRALGRILLAASDPRLVTMLSAGKRWATMVLPPRREKLAVGLERHGAADLAVELSRLSLLPAVDSLENLREGYLSDAGFVVTARTRHGRLMGAHVLHADGRTLTSSIVVRWSHRGAGVGKRLLAEGLCEARRRGATQVLAEIRRDNTASRRLFESFEFKLIEKATRAVPSAATHMDLYELRLR